MISHLKTDLDPLDAKAYSLSLALGLCKRYGIIQKKKNVSLRCGLKLGEGRLSS